MNRRTLLHHAAYAAIASQLTQLRAAPAGLQTRLAFADWTMGLAANPKSLELAKRIGLDGVQVDFGAPNAAGQLPLFDEALQETYLAKSKELGMAVPSLALATLNNVPLKSEAKAEEWVLASVKVAQRLKTRCVLLAFFGKGSLAGDEAAIANGRRFLQKLAPLAAEAGIIYGVESTLKAPVLEKMLETVNSSAIQVWYDPANMDREGEDYGSAIRRLGKERICEFHAKDFDALYGHGHIDFPQMRDAIRDGWTNAWIHIEGTKFPTGLEPGLRSNTEYLRGLFHA